MSDNLKVRQNWEEQVQYCIEMNGEKSVWLKNRFAQPFKNAFV